MGRQFRKGSTKGGRRPAGRRPPPRPASIAGVPLIRLKPVKDGGIPAPAGGGALIRAAGGAAVGAVLAVGWWELLFLPLGASHDGRINGRFGLHVRNFLEHGWAGSDWLASLAPYSDVPYAHHPPLLNVLQAMAGGVFGLGEWQLHLAGYLAGLATVAGMLWLTRELGLGAGASVLALALTVSTPMYWIYARLGLGMSIMTALAALWVRWERTGKGRGLLAAASGAAAFSSWMGAVLAVLAAGAGMRGAERRKAAVRAGAAGLAGAAAALAWCWRRAGRRNWPATPLPGSGGRNGPPWLRTTDGSTDPCSPGGFVG